jgi:hypothetical protein
MRMDLIIGISAGELLSLGVLEDVEACGDRN